MFSPFQIQDGRKGYLLDLRAEVPPSYGPIGNTRVEVHARADLLQFGVHVKDEALARPRLDTRSRRGRDRIRSLGILLVLELVCATDKDVRRVWMRAKLDRISR
jgi:hypothetical protein